MKRFSMLVFALSLVVLSGCAGSGEVTKLRLYDVMHSSLENAGGNLSVAMSGFEDQRPPSLHLGSHNCFFGGVNHFDLMDGKLSEGLSTAFVDFLNKSGFKASGQASGPADVRISGKITKFTANAQGQFLSTNMSVDAIMVFTIANVADGSTVRMTIGAGGTDDVIFFGPEDLENLVNEVLQEGFEELVEKTSVQGKTLRRKV